MPALSLPYAAPLTKADRDAIAALPPAELERWIADPAINTHVRGDRVAAGARYGRCTRHHLRVLSTSRRINTRFFEHFTYLVWQTLPLNRSAVASIDVVWEAALAELGTLGQHHYPMSQAIGRAAQRLTERAAGGVAVRPETFEAWRAAAEQESTRKHGLLASLAPALLAAARVTEADVQAWLPWLARQRGGTAALLASRFATPALVRQLLTEHQSDPTTLLILNHIARQPALLTDPDVVELILTARPQPKARAAFARVLEGDALTRLVSRMLTALPRQAVTVLADPAVRARLGALDPRQLYRVLQSSDAHVRATALQLLGHLPLDNGAPSPLSAVPDHAAAPPASPPAQRR